MHTFISGIFTSVSQILSDSEGHPGVVFFPSPVLAITDGARENRNDEPKMYHLLHHYLSQSQATPRVSLASFFLADFRRLVLEWAFKGKRETENFDV